MSEPARILHLVTGLDRGGTQTMLTRLVTRLDRARFAPLVLPLIGGGAQEAELRAAGVPVIGLGMRRGVPSPAAWLRLKRLIRAERPRLIQSWLYHADLLAVLAAGAVPVVWNLRLSSIAGERRKLRLRLLQRVLAALSARPALVIANSEAGRRMHESLGYRPRRWEIVPNGFDVERFQPDEAARRDERRRLGIGEDELLIGMAARIDGMKDHAAFLAMAETVAAARADARFVLIGAGTETLAIPRTIARRIIALGERSDLERLYPALDLHVLASLGEGFPNVVGEAMAACVPCVTSDVGAAAALIGDTGLVVPPGDSGALATAVLSLLDRGRDDLRHLGRAARRRVERDYALDAVAARYATIYDRVIGEAPRPRSA